MYRFKVGDTCFYLTHLFLEGSKVFYMAEGVISALIDEKHCYVMNRLSNQVFACVNSNIILQTIENTKNNYIRVRTQGRIMANSYIKPNAYNVYYTDRINFYPKYVGLNKRLLIRLNN